MRLLAATVADKSRLIHDSASIRNLAGYSRVSGLSDEVAEENVSSR